MSRYFWSASGLFATAVHVNCFAKITGVECVIQVQAQQQEENDDFVLEGDESEGDDDDDDDDDYEEEEEDDDDDDDYEEEGQVRSRFPFGIVS